MSDSTFDDTEGYMKQNIRILPWVQPSWMPSRAKRMWVPPRTCCWVMVWFCWFSRMRSEGFLFSFLGVWGWWIICSSFCFLFSNRVVPLSLGKVFVTCDSAFRVAGVGLCRFRRKLLPDSLIASSRCLWEKGLCCTQAKVASRFSNIYAARCLWGKWQKVMCCDVWKWILRGRPGALWHSGESCSPTL